ncbi:MAG TPA: GNAT family N-acetyltransferase [Candidatus Limnocylindrales bacterium]|jgi:GNAT superfamily N-acetyltransferase|nr:GNAT family N-acetyltransferase [Candidatus Limnocylindrales bacterium]
MVADVDLIEAADRNFLGSYRKLVDHMLAGETRDFGGVFAFVTGLPIGMFNGCIVTAPAATEDLRSALDWIVGHDVPYRLWIHEELADHLAEAVRERGMEQGAWLMPQMVLQPVPETPSPAPGVSVRAVSDARSLDEYRRVSVEDGTSENVVGRLYSDSFAADPDVQLVTAYLDHRAVGTSLAIRTGEVSGVYAVGTLPAARRRGVGTAATWAAVAAGRALGCESIVLQASEMGFPLYRAMGFRTVVRYSLFRPSA